MHINREGETITSDITEKFYSDDQAYLSKRKQVSEQLGIPDLWEISSDAPRLWNKGLMEFTGYNNPSRDEYFIYGLKEIDSPEFAEYRWDVSKLKGYNKNSFCIKAGIKPQTLHHIISGRKTKPSFVVLEKILSTFVDVSTEWLITGSGEPIITEFQKINIKNEQPYECDILCTEYRCRDYKVLEMARKINEYKQQISELEKDKEDLRAILKIFKTKFENKGS